MYNVKKENAGSILANRAQREAEYTKQRERERLKDIKKQQIILARNAQCTLNEHCAELKRLGDIAETKGRIGSAIAAEISRGKAMGFYRDQPPISYDHPVELFTLLVRVFGDELARDIAQNRLGFKPDQLRLSKDKK